MLVELQELAMVSSKVFVSDFSIVCNQISALVICTIWLEYVSAVWPRDLSSSEDNHVWMLGHTSNDQNSKEAGGLFHSVSCIPSLRAVPTRSFGQHHLFSSFHIERPNDECTVENLLSPAACHNSPVAIPIPRSLALSLSSASVLPTPSRTQTALFPTKSRVGTSPTRAGPRQSARRQPPEQPRAEPGS